MKVQLNRNLYLGGVLYERDINGTELPEEIDGLEVVLWSPEAKKKAQDERDAPTTIVLPEDAKLWKIKGVAKRSDLLKNAGQQGEVALSELAKGTAGKSVDEVVQEKKK